MLSSTKMFLLVSKYTLMSSLISVRTNRADFLLKLALNICNAGVILYLFYGVTRLSHLNQTQVTFGGCFIFLLLTIDSIFQVLFGYSIHGLGKFVREKRMDSFFVRPHISPILILVRDINFAAAPSAFVFALLFLLSLIQRFGWRFEFLYEVPLVICSGLSIYLAITCTMIVLPVLRGVGIESARGLYLASLRFAQLPRELVIKSAPALYILFLPFFSIASIQIDMLTTKSWILYIVGTIVLSLTVIVKVTDIACKSAMERAL